MELSVLVAKMLALTYIAAAAAALSGRITFAKMIEDFEKSPALTFVSGFVTLVMGMVLVEYHNRWATNWTVLITVVGWAALFKGVMLIAYPSALSCFKSWYGNNRLWGIVMLAAGGVFGYFGFFS